LSHTNFVACDITYSSGSSKVDKQRKGDWNGWPSSTRTVLEEGFNSGQLWFRLVVVILSLSSLSFNVLD